MSRRVTVVAFALAAAATTAGAQSRQELTRRLDMAVAAKTRAHDSLVLYRHQKGLGIYPDTTTVANGAIRVITTPDLAETVHDAARRADALLRHSLSGAMPLGAGAVIYVRSDSALKSHQLATVG